MFKTYAIQRKENDGTISFPSTDINSLLVAVYIFENLVKDKGLPENELYIIEADFTTKSYTKYDYLRVREMLGRAELVPS